MQLAAQWDERFYGLGQHSHGMLNQRGAVIDLDQFNTEVNVPLLFSSRGYALLWNVPSRGRVELAANRTRFVATATRQVCWHEARPCPCACISFETHACPHAHARIHAHAHTCMYAQTATHAPALESWGVSYIG
jgi:alpha-D-xyloside xylohydrolase